MERSDNSPPPSIFPRTKPLATRCSANLSGIKVSQSDLVFPSSYTFSLPTPVVQEAGIHKLSCTMPTHVLSRSPLTSLPEGLSFTPDQRASKNLTGLLPHVMEGLDRQCERALKMIRSRQTNIDKYLYLSHIKGQNVDLFYRLLIDHAKEMMPLVYTPTIGDVCLQYSTLYTRPEALYISIKQRKSMKTILRNWPYPNPEICVVTDGSRILGLGDLGVNGVGIPVSLAPESAGHLGGSTPPNNTRIRSANLPCTPQLPASTPRRRFLLSLIVELPTKQT